MTNRKSVAVITMALAVVSGLAGACDDAEGLKTAKHFVESVVLSADCSTGLKAFEVDDFWVRECAKREGAHRELHAEFSRRTTAVVEKLRLVDALTYALVRFKGPDRFAFSMALNRAGSCLGSNDTLFPSMKMDGCGSDFWKDIPVKEYEGAIPLRCSNGRWAVVALKPSRPK